jgi:hypothetical protein
MRRTLIAFPLAAWALFAALAFSFAHDSYDTCASDALWTTGWFFLPPVLVLPGFATTRPARAGSLLASFMLLAAWALFGVVWFFSALGCGGGEPGV